MQAHSIKTRVESAHCVCSQRLKPEYHRLLSTFALSLKLRRYTQVEVPILSTDLTTYGSDFLAGIGACLFAHIVPVVVA